MYILRRKLNKGYRWYIVEPKRVGGKLKRECTYCLGEDVEEIKKFLRSRSRTKAGKELYEKFKESLVEMKKPKRRKKKKPL